MRDKDARFVFLGDYVDRGRQSRDVVELLFKTQARAPDQVVCLKGNHEDMLLSAAKGGDEALWLDNGGDTTLRSYGVERAAGAAHLAWFDRCRSRSSDEKRFFVHAGIMPGMPLQKQSKDVMLWIREPFLSDRRDHGLFIVHGHTPTEPREPDFRRNRLNLDTGAYFGGPLTAAVFDEARSGRAPSSPTTEGPLSPPRLRRSTRWSRTGSPSGNLHTLALNACAWSICG